MTTLDPRSGHLVLINTFTVEPARAGELLAILSEATANGMCQRSGFISANLHFSYDRRHLANDVQWRSWNDLDPMMRDPLAPEHMRRAAAIATAYEPLSYDLCETHAPAPSGPMSATFEEGRLARPRGAMADPS